LEIKSSSRIAIVDILRGWALLGVVICNYIDFDFIKAGGSPDKSLLSEIIGQGIEYLLSAKSWTLLCLLFGFSFGIFLQKKNDQGNQNTRFHFMKRMLFLFLFAVVNCFLFFGDILRDYAMLGLLLLFFYRFSPKTLFRISLLMFLLLPFFSAFVNTLDTTAIVANSKAILPLYTSHSVWDVLKYNILESYYSELINPFYLYTVHYLMFLCMILGLAAQKSSFFTNLETHRKTLKVVVVCSLIFVLILMAIFRFKLINFDYFRPGYWTVVATMLFNASCICLLYLNGKCKKLFSAFSIVGKMTLTNYLMQNAISFFVFQGIGLRVFDTMPYYFYFFFAIGIFILQVFFSKWWLSRYQYGPVEWLWRSLSNTRKWSSG
jgi:uncharacterized protein